MKGEIMGDRHEPGSFWDELNKRAYGTGPDMGPSHAGDITIHTHPKNTGLILPPVDAHAQMLAARVEGLEKELNGLQHVWGRVKALEAEVARLSLSEPVTTLDGGRQHDVDRHNRALELLRECREALPVNSFMTHRISVFLRGTR